MGLSKSDAILGLLFLLNSTAGSQSHREHFQYGDKSRGIIIINRGPLDPFFFSITPEDNVTCLQSRHFTTCPKSPPAGPEISLTKTVFHFILFLAVSVRSLGERAPGTATHPAKMWGPQSRTGSTLVSEGSTPLNNPSHHQILLSRPGLSAGGDKCPSRLPTVTSNSVLPSV